MAWRFRRSKKILPGVKVNIGKKSASVTVGGKLFRQTISTSGRKTTSASIPGTGLYYSETTRKSAPAAPRNVKSERAFGFDARGGSRAAKVLFFLAASGLVVCTIAIFVLLFTDWLSASVLEFAVAGVAIFGLISWVTAGVFD